MMQLTEGDLCLLEAAIGDAPKPKRDLLSLAWWVHALLLDLRALQDGRDHEKDDLEREVENLASELEEAESTIASLREALAEAEAALEKT